MSGKYLLDTNIIIALFADEVAVKSNLVQADEVFIPNIAVGELCYGARRSGRSKENLERIDELIANSTVIGCDTETARYRNWSKPTSFKRGACKQTLRSPQSCNCCKRWRLHF